MKGYFTHVDSSDNTLNYKIRHAQLSQYNIILVCGEKEKDGAQFTVRLNDGSQLGSYTMDQLVEYCESLIPKPSDQQFKVQENWKDYETKHSKDYNDGNKVSGLKRVSVQSKDVMQDCEDLLKKQRFLGGEEPNAEDKELFAKIKEQK